MKTRFVIVVSLAVLVLGGAFFFTRSKDTPAETLTKDKAPQSVQTARVADRETAVFAFSFPGSIGYESEAILTAQVAGTVVTAPIEINQRVTTGQLLFKIDETGSQIASQSGFQSADIQQAALALKNAEKEYTEAKHNDKRDDTTASETAKDQARNDRDSASLSYQTLLNKRLVKSPITGIVTYKESTEGDTVSSGTPLTTISNGKKIIRFYVSDAERLLLSPGHTLEFSQEIGGNQRLSAVVKRVSEGADTTSQRFLVEAESSDLKFSALPAGSIVTIFATLKKTARAGNFFLPLSALLREQNGSALFLHEDGRAKRVPITLVTIIGETVELSGIADRESRIVMTHVKQIKDGDTLILE